MKALDNPFVISGYEGAHYFCDRGIETEQLRHEIANGNNVALIAARRMGKSGLIEHYFSQQEIQERYYTFSLIYTIPNRFVSWCASSAVRYSFA